MVDLILFLIKLLFRDNEPPRRVYRPPSTPPPYSGGGSQADASEDERLRKFMEALGVPPGGAPPRPITRPQQQRQSQPVGRIQPVRRQTPVRQATPARQTPRPAAAPPPIPARYIAPAETSYQTETVVPVVTQESGASRAAVISIPASTATAATTDLKALLRSPSSVRTAMLLKEILGAPRALQAGEIIPGLR